MNARALKLAAWKACRAAGLFNLVRRSRWRRDRLLILCYHGLGLEHEHEWNPTLFLSAPAFRRRLEALRRSRIRVMRLDDAVKALAADELDEPTAVITFDDGLFDFYKLAVPLLAEFDFPATVYVSTFHVDYQRPVFNVMLAYVLWLGRHSGKTIGAEAGLSEPIPVAPWYPASSAVIAAAFERGLSAEQKDALTQNIAKTVGVDYERLVESRVLALMRPEEVREAARNPLVDVELHTHRHRTPDDEALFRREIRDNRRRLGELTGDPDLRHFCYPSGVCKPQFLPWLRAEGVATATTCLPALATRADDPLMLPRKIDTMAVSDVEFDAWLTGFEPLVYSVLKK